MSGRAGVGVMGQAIGSTWGPLGAALGGAIGSYLGGQIDESMQDAVPRPEAAHVQISAYGVPLARLFGHPRTAGVMFWAAPLEEEAVEGDGGKGGGGPADNPASNWKATFAVALSSTEVRGIRRIWANGVLVFDDTFTADFDSTRNVQYTLYHGTETQLPDATLEAYEGAGNVPAYRGTAYVVIHDLSLAAYGNQIPTLEFEVMAAGTWAMGEEDGHDTAAVASGVVWSHMVYRADGVLILLGAAGSGPLQWMLQDGRTWEVLQTGVFSGIAGPDLTDAIFVPQRSSLWLATSPNTNTRITEFNAFDFSVMTAEFDLGILPLGNPGASLAYDPVMPAINIIRGSQLASWSIQRFDLPTLTLGKTDDTLPYGLGIVSGGDAVQVWLYRDWLVARSVTPAEANSEKWDAVNAAWESVNNIGSWPAPATQSVGAGVRSCGCFDPLRRRYVLLTTTGNLYTLADAEVTSFVQVAAGLPGATTGGKLLFSAALDAYILRRDDSALVVIDATTYAALLNAGGPHHKAAMRLSAIDPGAVVLAGSPTNGTGPRVAEVSLYGTTVGAAVRGLCLAAGYADSDVQTTPLTQRLHGFRVIAQAPVRPALEQLGAAYFFEGAEEDGQLRFKRRGGISLATYAADDCVVADPAARPINSRRAAENELPRSLDLVMPDAAADYQPGTQTAQRQASTQGEERRIAVDVVMAPTDARRVADAMLFDAWAGRDTASVQLPAAGMRLTQGDVLTLAGRRMRVLSRRIENYAATVDLVADDASITQQFANGATSGFRAQSVPLNAPVVFSLLYAPLLRDEDDTYGGYWAASSLATGYSAADLYVDIDGTEENEPDTFTKISTVEGSATAGGSLNVLGAPAHVWQVDHANALHVRINYGALSSCTYAQMLSGRNAAMLGRELLHFQTAALQVDGTWILTGLLRGRRGTEWACAGHKAGENFVALSTTTTGEYKTIAEVHGAVGWWAAFGRSTYSTSRAAPRRHVQEDYRLKPLAPVYLRADRNTADIPITWQRRSRYACRFAGEAGVQVPLGEYFEVYELELYTAGGVLKRTARGLNTPTYTYTAAQRTEDLGSTTAAFKAVAYQKSERVGRGTPSEMTTL